VSLIFRAAGALPASLLTQPGLLRDLLGFAILGSPAAAVCEAPVAGGMALRARRIALSRPPADQPKKRIHGILPVARGLMTALGAIARRIGVCWAKLGNPQYIMRRGEI
jgi:hypothetical protein